MKQLLAAFAAFAFLWIGADTQVRPYVVAAGARADVATDRVGADPRVGPSPYVVAGGAGGDVATDAVGADPRVGPSQASTPRAPDAAREKRLEWFREAKYGLFIHWGLYAIPAGQWNGRRSPGLGEWVMFRSQVPVKEYEKLAGRSNPVKFNADECVKVAKDAGMKYIVITSKHHDGFALWKSKASSYNIVDATPFKRDAL